MKTYISILRGINVGGHKSIKMLALSQMFEDLGFTKVKTYIQSGNIVFQCPKKDPLKLASDIAEKISDTFSFEVPVIVLELEEVEKVHQNNLFISKNKYDINFLHVTFLSQKPKQIDIDKISGDYGKDEFLISGKAIYLYCPNGYGNTKLTNTFFESKLKVPATTRNWKTVTELVNIASSL